jgi:hypothetical protein
MRTALTYTLSRLLLFVAVLLLLDLAGARGLLLIALALLISGLLSYVLLSRQRDAMAGSLFGRLSGRARRAGSFRSRLAEGARAEDTDDEEQATPAPAPAPDQR